MAPRNISATSVSTTSELSHSMFTESHATESQNVHSAGPASIDVMSLDDPAAMSPQAIKAELQYYGVQLKFNSLSKQELEDELIKARHNNSGKKSSSNNNQHQQQYEPSKRGTSPQHHIEATAAKHTGIRTSSPPNHNNNTNSNDFQTKYPPSTTNGITPTHIPLTPTNRIPPQILNIIRTSADTSMKAINLDHRSLGDSEVIKLSEAMERNKTVQHLSLRNCHISDDAINKLSNMLIKNSTLKELYLDANNISTEGAAALSTALITNETLVVLTLNDNPKVGEKGIVYLIGALEHNKTLRTLDVHHNCGINNTSANNSNNNNGRAERRRSRSRSPGSQSSGGGKSRTINRLDQLDKLLESRQIDSNFESLLERLLDDDYRVTGIDLSGRKIGNVGVTRLADALSDNTQVRQLWLRGCNISNEGALALSSCLEQNMTIVDLFLGNNSIGNEGVIGFADALANSNQTLVSLELDDNDVGVHGFNEFMKALELNTSVLVASFTNNRELNDVDHHDLLERKLSEKRDSLNLISFIVDPNAGDSYHGSQATSAQDKQGGNNSGLVNMSVCSSYMPSTYRRAGFTSQAGGTGPTNPNTNGSPNDKHLRNSGSYKFSTYNRSNSQDGPTGVPLQGRPPVAPKHHPPPPPPPPPLYGQQPKQQQQQQQQQYNQGGGGGQLVRHSSDGVSEASGSQQDYNNNARQGRGGGNGSVKSSSNNSRSRPNNAYERANVPVPIKAHALDPIQEGNSFGGSGMESHCSTLSSTVGTGKHRVKSVATARNSEAPSKRSTGRSHSPKDNNNNNNKNSDNNLLIPVVEEEMEEKKNEMITPLVQEKKGPQVPIMKSTELVSSLL